jgi:hypothetical protein
MHTLLSQIVNFLLFLLWDRWAIYTSQRIRTSSILLTGTSHFGETVFIQHVVCEFLKGIADLGSILTDNFVHLFLKRVEKGWRENAVANIGILLIVPGRGIGWSTLTAFILKAVPTALSVQQLEALKGLVLSQSQFIHLHFSLLPLLLLMWPARTLKIPRNGPSSVCTTPLPFVVVVRLSTKCQTTRYRYLSYSWRRR